MTIFFTLCSKNYLAQAITLQHSFKNVHPEIDFILGIVDCLSDEEKKLLDGYFFLEMDQLGVEAFESMKSKYNIVELNTAVKPFYIEYFFKNGYEKSYNSYRDARQRQIYGCPGIFKFKRSRDRHGRCDKKGNAQTWNRDKQQVAEAFFEEDD